MADVFEPRLPPSAGIGKTGRSPSELQCTEADEVSTFRARNVDFAFIKTHLSLGFRWNAWHPNPSRRRWIRRRPQFSDQTQDLGKQHSRHGDLGHLEGDVATVADKLRPDLHELLPEAGQRPVRDCLGQGQRPQEVAEIVGERVKPKPNLVVTELLARGACLFDRVFAFLDPLLRRAAPIGERHHLLVGTV